VVLPGDNPARQVAPNEAPRNAASLPRIERAARFFDGEIAAQALSALDPTGAQTVQPHAMNNLR